MRARTRLTLIPAFALIVAACGGGASTAPSGTATATATPGTTAEATPDACATENLETLTAGTLTIGADNPAFPPYFQPSDPAVEGSEWEIGEPTNGQGLEAATAYAVAEQLGFTADHVAWVSVLFNNAIQAGPKDFDLYLTQVSYSAERAQAVDLSDGYFDLNQAVIGNAGTPIDEVTTVAGLKEFKLGAPVGTTSYDYIVDNIQPTQDPSVYDDLSGAFQALNAGQIDGVVVAERAWIWPDRNEHQQWLEDEFQVPAAYVAGKARISLRVVPEAVAGRIAWNEYRYSAFALLAPGTTLPPAPALPVGKELPPLAEAPPPVAVAPQVILAPDYTAGRSGGGLFGDGLGRAGTERFQWPARPEFDRPEWTCSLALRCPAQRQAVAVVQRGKRGEPGAWMLHLGPSGNRQASLVLAGTTADGKEQVLPLSARLDDEAWHEVEIRLSPSEAQVTIDGREAGRLRLGRPLAAGAAPISFGGAWSQDQVMPFLGTLDDLRFTTGGADGAVVVQTDFAP